MSEFLESLCAMMSASMQCHPLTGVVVMIECRRAETVAQDMQASEKNICEAKCG